MPRKCKTFKSRSGETYDAKGAREPFLGRQDKWWELPRSLNQTRNKKKGSQFPDKYQPPPVDRVQLWKEERGAYRKQRRKELKARRQKPKPNPPGQSPLELLPDDVIENILSFMDSELSGCKGNGPATNVKAKRREIFKRSRKQEIIPYKSNFNPGHGYREIIIPAPRFGDTVKLVTTCKTENGRKAIQKQHPFFMLAATSKTLRGVVENYCGHMLEERAHKVVIAKHGKHEIKRSLERRANFSLFLQKQQALHRTGGALWDGFCNRKKWIIFLSINCYFCCKRTDRYAIFNNTIRCCGTCDREIWPKKLVRSRSPLAPSRSLTLPLRLLTN